MVTGHDTVTVHRFVDHLRAAHVTTCKLGPEIYDNHDVKYWGYVSRAICTKWLDAFYCWEFLYSRGQPPSTSRIREHSPSGWSIHLHIHVLDQEGQAIEERQLQALIKVHTSIAEPSLLNRSVLGTRHCISQTISDSYEMDQARRADDLPHEEKGNVVLAATLMNELARRTERNLAVPRENSQGLESLR
jgi:hypothetical protein